ncbi:MAG: YHS domain-containing (seleno)protein [Pseudomonadota bacterium]
MTMKTLARHFIMVVLTVILAGCANSGGGKLGPYNISVDHDDKNLMLNGYDPVAYQTVGKNLRGKPEIKTDFDGVTYRFENELNRAAFLNEPLRYVPQFGGFCANGIAYGIPWGGDGDTWKLIDGKLYIFGGQSSKNYFLMDEPANLKYANDYWVREIKNGNAIIRRYWRLVLRVPHYKTGAELEQLWQQKPKSANAQ